VIGVGKGKYRVVFTEDELELAMGCVQEVRTQVLEKWKSTNPGAERDFYSKQIDGIDTLFAKFEAALVADTSTDAEPDEDEGSEDS